MAPFDKFLAAVRQIPEGPVLHADEQLGQDALGQLVHVYQLLGDSPYRDTMSRVKKRSPSRFRFRANWSNDTALKMHFTRRLNAPKKLYVSKRITVMKSKFTFTLAAILGGASSAHADEVAVIANPPTFFTLVIFAGACACIAVCFQVLMLVRGGQLSRSWQLFLAGFAVWLSANLA